MGQPLPFTPVKKAAEKTIALLRVEDREKQEKIGLVSKDSGKCLMVPANEDYRKPFTA